LLKQPLALLMSQPLAFASGNLAVTIVIPSVRYDLERVMWSPIDLSVDVVVML